MGAYPVVAVLLCLASHAVAQAPGKWPPDSLVNTRRGTSHHPL